MSPVQSKAAFRAELERFLAEESDATHPDPPLQRYQVGGGHYLQMDIQPWDAMRAWMSPVEFQGFLRGNAIKYIARFRAKGGIEDLRKAMHYIETLIAEIERVNAGAAKPCATPGPALSSELSPTPKIPTHRSNPVMQALQLPPLVEGETYIGAIGDQQGNLHHVIQLAGDHDDASWKDQMAWAKSRDGDLPTRVELNLIWERNRDQMQKDFYWTNEVYHRDSSYAWYQSFDGGIQDCGHESSQLRAVAVRRLPI